MTVVEALGPTVAVLKPQSAFFESYGSAGIAVLERVLADTREAGALVLLDAKRGDIGSTMAAYAAAYLAPASPLAADALTVSPYLGFGSLARARRPGGGPRAVRAGPDVEPGGPAGAARPDRRRAAGRAVDRRPGGAVNAGAYAIVGLVVGATIGKTGVDLSGARPAARAGPRRAGSRRGRAGRRFSGTRCTYVLPSASRELMGVGPDPVQIRLKAEQMLAQMRTAVSVR